jgi:hypothetical protein
LDIGKRVRRLFKKKEQDENQKILDGIREIPKITIVAVADLHLCFSEDVNVIPHAVSVPTKSSGVSAAREA